ncbi:MAG TPA: Crp/Fnr family transcriptional regulator [Flavitalea sp.]|nr:Crp/Fnr family transcriptional regulator [Flavitalea sp.]
MVRALKEYLGGFLALSDEDFDEIAKVSEIRTYDKKTRLIEEGEEEKYLNFVVKGLVRKFFLNGDEEVITQLAREGEVINSSVSFLSGEPSQYIVETIEPSTFISVSLENITMLYEKDVRWQRLGRLIITDLYLQKETWELERAAYNTQERFIRFVNTNTALFQRVPQKFLASYLNIQPETFSRLKHLLRNRSFVANKANYSV